MRWGGDILVIVVSLLLAMVVWGVMKLSATYHYLFYFHVEVSSPMEGRVFNTVSEDLLTFRGSSSGFYLLRHKYSVRNKDNVLHFRVNPSVLKPLEGMRDGFFLHSSVLNERLGEMLEGSVVVEDILSDTLVFTIPKTFQKLVPVCLRTDVSYASEYMPLEKVSLKPDSILIMGEEGLVSGIDSVFTEKVYGRSVSRSLQGVARIEQIPGVEMSSGETVYSLRIGRYVERSLDLDVEVRNMPASSRMTLIPSVVKITFREEYGRKTHLQSNDFSAYVDFGQALEAESGKARVQLDKLPAGVLNLTVEPLFLDRIIVE